MKMVAAPCCFPTQPALQCLATTCPVTVFSCLEPNHWDAGGSAADSAPFASSLALPAPAKKVSQRPHLRGKQKVDAESVPPCIGSRRQNSSAPDLSSFALHDTISSHDGCVLGRTPGNPRRDWNLKDNFYHPLTQSVC